MSDMNNFFMNQDPLLPNTPMQQMNPYLYQQLQQMNIKDTIGELDKALKEMNPSAMNRISQDERFIKLNNEFQNEMHKELIALVRNKLNTNPAVVENVKEQMRLIEDTKKAVESEKEASLNEMNDYMKNYSHLTFEDYRKMKNGEPIDKKKK